MDALRNSKMLQYDSAETRNVVTRPAEFLKQNPASRALNYSIQTGEEFSFEFMRDKNVSGSPCSPNTSEHQITSSSSVYLRQRRAISNAAGLQTDSDSPISAAEKRELRKEIQKKVFLETKSSDQVALTRTVSHASAGSNSTYRGFNVRYAALKSTPTRVKSLCSYGGKFLPRPSDGKLRYVGGDTHIIQLSKDMPWKELMERTKRMYNQTQIIKYQLPGEEIDALVSVFCDEDLQHMIDEFIDLEYNHIEQKPRMFLFSSDDNAHFTLGTMEGDSETQFLAAINGFDVAEKASSCDVLIRTSASEMGQSLIFSVELDEVKRKHKAETPSFSIHHHDNFSSDENGIQFSSSVPSDYELLIHHQKDADKKEVTPQSEQKFSSPVQLHDVPVSHLQLEALYGTPEPDFISPNHHMKHLETCVSSPLDVLSAIKIPKEHPQPWICSRVTTGYSESGNLAIAGKSPKSNESSIRDELRENQRYRASVPVIQTNWIELESTMSRSDNSVSFKQTEKSSYSESNQEDVTLAYDLASNQADNKKVKMGYQFQHKFDKNSRTYLSSSMDDEKDTLNQGRIWNASDKTRSIESSSSDGKTSMSKVYSQELLGDGSDAMKQASPPIMLGSIQKQKERNAAAHQGNSSPSPKEHSHNLDFSNSQFIYEIGSISIPKVKSAKEFSNINTSSTHGSINGLKMSSNESQPPLMNLCHDELTSEELTVKKQPHETSFLMKISSLEHMDLGLKNPHVDFDEVESSLANVGEHLKTALMEFEETASDRKEVNDPGPDTSTEVPSLRNLQRINNEDLEELRELGAGTFGTVYHGKWRGTDVAIKRINRSYFIGHSSQTEKMISGFWREVGILSKLHHPNVVAFYGVVMDEQGGTMATVTEYMTHGSLKHVLRRKERHLDFRKRLLIAMDVAIGMEYLHSRNVVHFDLKCDNLLVNLKDSSRPICKVCDFGLSKMKLHTMVSGGVRGTLPWMAPELLYISSNKVSEKIDVYSFGIVMWEILTGKEPYEDMHYGEVIGGLLHNTLRPTVPDSCDKDWRVLMEQCWAVDPEQRPTFTQIASHLKSMYKGHQSRE
ncbi:RAF-like serine/threonine-protein kinase 24 [Curcuma longa]|uniref:RAF-like serine/threonine-protein kinase 24 n=1 Tax=Curcuma longa TaxID=136217 RepID=UPI003D9DFE6E